MMEQAMRSAVRIILIALVIVSIPMIVLAKGYEKAEEEFGGYDLYMGHNYIISVKVGDSPIVSFYYENATGPDDDEAHVKSAVSSKPNIVRVERYADPSDIFIDALVGGRTAIVTVKDTKGKTCKIKVKTLKSKKKIKPDIEVDQYVYKSTKKIKVRVGSVLKGDIVKLKVGKRTYKKKIKKAAFSKTLKFKIKKPGFYGHKYKIKVIRKKKTVATWKENVYLGKKIKLGYTKKQVKWIRKWNKPYRKTRSSHSEVWYYDWNKDDIDDAYVVFSKKTGKVTYWYKNS